MKFQYDSPYDSPHQIWFLRGMLFWTFTSHIDSVWGIWCTTCLFHPFPTAIYVTDPNPRSLPGYRKRPQESRVILGHLGPLGTRHTIGALCMFHLWRLLFGRRSCGCLTLPRHGHLKMCCRTPLIDLCATLIRWYVRCTTNKHERRSLEQFCFVDLPQSFWSRRTPPAPQHCLNIF